ncbi:MAG: hypothetical protein AAF645_30370 [Myxococcota bacterium]
MKRLLPFLALLLVGPAPGNTGGCAASQEDDGADFLAFCLESRSFACLRAEARGEEVDVQACVDAALESCEAIGFWPPSCEPPPRIRETDACIDELRRSDNLNLRLRGDDGLPEIDECRLCS